MLQGVRKVWLPIVLSITSPSRGASQVAQKASLLFPIGAESLLGEEVIGVDSIVPLEGWLNHKGRGFEARVNNQTGGRKPDGAAQQREVRRLPGRPVRT